ncbi:MAG: hypothetical protein H6726_32165 [Sandaracinaceae bacterium]|nr:hypothetical protein [Myxococcales bacterium]MCB9662339.1 hypothetical protein [Sandaracinaceae bacterium]
MRSAHSLSNPSRAVVVGGFIVFASVAMWGLGGYVVDDAYVVFRVVRRVAAGQPWAFQGEAAADGVTGPAWAALLLLCARFGALPAVARVVGSLCALAGAALVLFLATGTPRASRARTCAALYLACQLPLVVWAGAGLETGLATLVLAVATCGLYAELPSPTRAARGVAALWALALFSVPWLRPELVPVACLAAWCPVVGPSARRLRVAGLASVASGTISVVAWRLVTFGHALPLAALAKPSDPVAGVIYVARWLVGTGAATAIVVVCGAWLWTRGRDGLRAAWASCGPPRLPGAVGLGLLSVMLAGGDWMPGGRLVVPLLPLIALVVGRALARLSWPWTGALGLAVTSLVPVALWLHSFDALRAQPGVRERGGAEVLAALDGASCVALVDIGYLGYTGDLHVVDLGGITDLEVARLPGGHVSKRIPEGLLMARGVDAIVLHSSSPARVRPQGSQQQAAHAARGDAPHDAERAAGGRLVGLAGYPVELLVARMPFVQEQFRVYAQVAYAPDYHYVVLRRVPAGPPP